MYIEILVKLGGIAFIGIWFLAFYQESDAKVREGFIWGMVYGALIVFILHQ